MARTGIDKERNEYPVAARPVSDLIPFDQWLASLGRSKASGWRYRKKNLIPTVNLMGRIFVSRVAIADFERRAAAGEFSKAYRIPRPSKSDPDEPTTAL
jgi:hypothetical protein